MMFPVSLASARALTDRMRRLGLREEDLEESFVRSGGAGGQNVNKVATCVVLRHVPTGQIVKCQQARSQGLNRYYARCQLADRIERALLGRESAEAQRIAKERRQKRRRSRRAKAKMLDNKRARSETKAHRGRVRDDE